MRVTRKEQHFQETYKNSQISEHFDGILTQYTCISFSDKILYLVLTQESCLFNPQSKFQCLGLAPRGRRMQRCRVRLEEETDLQDLLTCAALQSTRLFQVNSNGMVVPFFSEFGYVSH